MYTTHMQIYLAPMEGITGYVVRNAFAHHFGHIDKYYTPFIPAAKRLSRKILRDLSPARNQGICLIPQLISNRAEEVLEMIRLLKDLGFTEVNLNLGCPSGTVVSKKRGSGLLQYPEELDRFLDGVYEKADIPVSIKTRIGFADMEEWPGLLQIYRKYPFHELIIHPRLRSELYKGFPHPEAFRMAYDSILKEASPDQTVHHEIRQLCYNGDIWDMRCYEDMHARFPSVETVMIGRGLLARPYLAWQIRSEEDAVPDADIRTCTSQQMRSRLRDFCDEIYQEYMVIFSGEKDVCMHMKEIWIHLGSSFRDSDRLVRKLMKCRTVSEYHALVSQIFDTLELTDF